MQNVVIKKIFLYRDFAAGVYLSEAQNPVPPPPYTQGRWEEGESWTREKGERGNSSQSWVKNTNMNGCISSLYTQINTCRKVPLHVNLLDNDICFGAYIVN